MDKVLNMMDKILFITILIWFAGFFILANIAGFEGLFGIFGMELEWFGPFMRMFIAGLAVIGFEFVLYCILSFINKD